MVPGGDTDVGASRTDADHRILVEAKPEPLTASIGTADARAPQGEAGLFERIYGRGRRHLPHHGQRSGAGVDPDGGARPAKWIARLHATMTGGGAVLLHQHCAGHGGALGRFSRLDEVATAYAFALWSVGMADP